MVNVRTRPLAAAGANGPPSWDQSPERRASDAGALDRPMQTMHRAVDAMAWLNGLQGTFGRRPRDRRPFSASRTLCDGHRHDGCAGAQDRNSPRSRTAAREPADPAATDGRSGCSVSPPLPSFVSVVSLGLGSQTDEGATASGGTLAFDIELGDLYVKPSSIEVPAGTELIVNVTNTAPCRTTSSSTAQTGTDDARPGRPEEVIARRDRPRPTEAWCTVPGHKEAGMVLDIEVTGAPPAAPGRRTAADAGDRRRRRSTSPPTPGRRLAARSTRRCSPRPAAPSTRSRCTPPRR